MSLTVHLILAILMSSLAGPPKTWAEYAHREDLLDAIEWVTSDPREQIVLIRIAWFESGLRESVHRCIGTPHAAKGTWQVKPRSRSEDRIVCGPARDQAQLAVYRVRESRRICASMVDQDSLGVYTIGRCERNEPASRLRWGE